MAFPFILSKEDKFMDRLKVRGEFGFWTSGALSVPGRRHVLHSQQNLIRSALTGLAASAIITQIISFVFRALETEGRSFPLRS